MLKSDVTQPKKRLLFKASAGLVVWRLAVLAGLMPAKKVMAVSDYNQKAFSAHSFSECFNALGVDVPQESSLLNINVPDMAENGAQVPVEIFCSIPRTTELAILVRHNPSVLAAHVEFVILAPEVRFSTKIKMARSSELFVLVKADGRYSFSKKDVRVTLGGCAA